MQLLVVLKKYYTIEIRKNTYYNIKKGMLKMPITSKEMIRLLKANGFVEIRQNGSHKFFENKMTGRRTTVPCHCRDLPVGTEKNILKQAGLI